MHRHDKLPYVNDTYVALPVFLGSVLQIRAPIPAQHHSSDPRARMFEHRHRIHTSAQMFDSERGDSAVLSETDNTW